MTALILASALLGQCHTNSVGVSTCNVGVANSYSTVSVAAPQYQTVAVAAPVYQTQVVRQVVRVPVAVAQSYATANVGLVNGYSGNVGVAAGNTVTIKSRGLLGRVNVNSAALSGAGNVNIENRGLFGRVKIR